ncbi:hypothetical protein CEXT_702341 [Caerostris extrusa]|uniref:Ycf15 n=1 Tax=Caerostris extrusa TaxID=172846 RepID=A0AAV4N877_CAEEX|nr:hypothetical protein CEXT_702341 [Caerostris extrusa]
MSHSSLLKITKPRLLGVQRIYLPQRFPMWSLKTQADELWIVSGVSVNIHISEEEKKKPHSSQRKIRFFCATVYLAAFHSRISLLSGSGIFFEKKGPFFSDEEGFDNKEDSRWERKKEWAL